MKSERFKVVKEFLKSGELEVHFISTSNFGKLLVCTTN